MNFSAVNSLLLKYPLANPSPPIYNSPTTPIGHSLFNLSKI